MTTQAVFDCSALFTGVLVSQGWATQGVVTVTGNYTPLASDAVILVNATGGAVTITLADFTAAPYVAGQRYTVIKTDTTANAVTLTGSAGQLISGSPNLVLNTVTPYTGVVADATSLSWQVWSGFTTAGGGGTPSGPAGGALAGSYPNPGLAIPVALAATTNGAMLTVTNSQSGPGTVPVLVAAVNSGDRALGLQVAGDGFTRLRVNADGRLNWGPGNLTQDTNLYRGAANVLQTDDALVATGLTLTTTPLPRASGGTGVATTPAAPQMFTPSDPAATASLTVVMMGIGATCTYTAASSGNVKITVTGLCQTTTAAQPLTLGGRYGTGTAPSNGAAPTGTRFGSATDRAIRAANAATGSPFTVDAIISLSAGVATWFDIALATSNAADTAQISALGVSIYELS